LGLLKEERMGKNRGRALKACGWAVGLSLAAFPAACKRDCGETVRLGDFEFSQGNYANAIKRYEQALREDPECYNVEGKLAEARRKAASER
jgi:tetratricopeptide (TPR) repeat protein